MPWWAPLGGLVGALAVIAGLLFVDKVGAGAFADQHQRAVGVAVAEDDFGAGLGQVAGRARGGLLGQGEDLARFVTQGFFRHVRCSF